MLLYPSPFVFCKGLGNFLEMPAHAIACYLSFMKPIIFALIAALCQLPIYSAQAQLAPIMLQHGPTVTATGQVIMVQLHAVRKGIQAVFDTDGQTLSGLGQEELNKKFTVVSSAASVINFVVKNGYRIAGFSSTEAATYGGTGSNGGGSNGCIVLFEQTR